MHGISTSTLRVLEPYPNILAFYDGRIVGKRLFSEANNWLDDGAYALGIASYAIIDGAEALVYDTGTSIAHGKAIRAELTRRGVSSIRVVLSHSHNDHIAGNEAFSDCDIIALQKTADQMVNDATGLATSNPPISPVVMPTTVFDRELALRIGSIEIELRPLDIHSFDGLVIYLPKPRILLAGDTLEDPITYVSEPARLGIHLDELERLAGWDISAILPCHGDPDIIAKGGYDTSLIRSTQSYIERLLESADRQNFVSASLRDFIAAEIKDGSALYFEAYEKVHQQNVEAVLKTKKRAAT